MMYRIFLTIAVLSSSFIAQSQSNDDKEKIEKVIQKFSSGVDKQMGKMILETFRDGAGYYATNNRDKILSVTPTQLAELHEAKRFGGRDRQLAISNIEISDDIVAVAKAIAQDDVVHYVYYITLSKIGGNWLIQSVLQHSKMKP